MTAQAHSSEHLGLFFGVSGTGPETGLLFDRMLRNSEDSTPGAEITTLVDGALRLGRLTRRFSQGTADDGNLAFFVDGDIRSLGGVDLTTSGPTSLPFGEFGSLYRADHDRLWSALDGSYCMVVRDGLETAIGADVAGTRNVYWWLGDGVLAFHSHFADLAASVPGRLSEDAGAIASFLACGNYPAGRTAFREVGHIGAGQRLRVSGGRAQAGDHFEMVYEAGSDRRDRKREIDRLIELLSHSVAQARRRSDRPVFPLSGGLDSRYLAAEFLHQTGDPAAMHTVTWGVGRERPGGDAQVAARVARALDVGNTWFEKPQWPTQATFGRAIYLSNGEADAAIHFSDDDALHDRLAREGTYDALFRGDECFGSGPTLLTRRPVLAVNGIARLGLDSGYDRFLHADFLRMAATEQDADLHAFLDGLGSASPTGARDEVHYAMRVRRVLAAYNRVKQAHMEVFTPYLSRPVLASMRGVDDALRADKALLRGALARRFPALAEIPFAVDDNLPRWDARARTDPRLAGFYREWFDRPGWLDGIGDKVALASAIDSLVTSPSAGVAADDEPPVASRLRAFVKGTLPGRLLRELTLDRRYAGANVPPYLRIGRVAVLHELLGGVQRRRASHAS